MTNTLPTLRLTLLVISNHLKRKLGTSSISPKINFNGQYWRCASHTLMAAIKCKLTKHQSQTGNKQSISWNSIVFTVRLLGITANLLIYIGMVFELQNPITFARGINRPTAIKIVETPASQQHHLLCCLHPNFYLKSKFSEYTQYAPLHMCQNIHCHKRGLSFSQMPSPINKYQGSCSLFLWTQVFKINLIHHCSQH